MRLIADLYSPDTAILPIGGYFTMGPREAAKACTLLKPKVIVGMHYGTTPALTGTPEQLRKYLPANLRRNLRLLTPGIAKLL
jgi:L-ascorbate metabolism protein UlaG (beta-lactamase superfamily)